MLILNLISLTLTYRQAMSQIVEALAMHSMIQFFNNVPAQFHTPHMTDIRMEHLTAFIGVDKCHFIIETNKTLYK